ncbi:PilZ domain-containing protein [Brevibacillus panacihumi]|uniref:PilZ domain-containing protein n=1 Tax=Brevibacillus panacihumi TaxID=497735 RepID=A0A3M8DGC5_9BACL|nr:PilZ domain-containing protein [Brevibacillus panacihumi]RNB86217.1 PilZ domain-containing protein [Brevibacillus panacihumi]
MADIPTLQPFLKDSRLQRGGILQLELSKQGQAPIPIIVEHAKAGYLVVSYEMKDTANLQLLGSQVRVTWETDSSVHTVDMEVVQEQSVWPIKILGLIPLSVRIDIALRGRQEPITPDFIIQVPYKVMGARPSEEKGEGVLLKFSPTHLVIGTDGYVAKGDFVNLSFSIPHFKQEIVGMAKVVEKNFEDSKALIELIFTDISKQNHEWIKKYYKMLQETASS